MSGALNFQSEQPFLCLFTKMLWVMTVITIRKAYELTLIVHAIKCVSVPWFFQENNLFFSVYSIKYETKRGWQDAFTLSQGPVLQVRVPLLSQPVPFFH